MEEKYVGKEVNLGCFTHIAIFFVALCCSVWYDDVREIAKDLCSRLPYGVKARVYNHWSDDIQDETITIENLHQLIKTFSIEDIKPYLFPLSSMTEEQYKEWCDLEEEPLDEILTRNANGEKMSTLEHHLLIAKSLTDSVNYCYKNHFDIYGLIPKGLAIDATGLNIY